MKGIWKMLTGQGEKEYRQEHKEFEDAIPDGYPFRADGYVRYGPGPMDYRKETASDCDLPEHPAHGGRFENTMQASNYRRANSMYGPQARQEHERFSATQRELARYEKENRVRSYMSDPAFLDWLEEKNRR